MKKTQITVSLVLLIALILSSLMSYQVFAETADESMTLHTEKNLLIDGNGNAVRLIGANFSLDERNPAGSGMIVSPELEKTTFKRLDLLFNDFGANMARVVVSQRLWYNSSDPEAENYYRSLVKKVINEATKAGKYVWIDNHSGRYGGLPDAETEEFWREMVALYKNQPNILFGLFNEPVNCDWEQWYNGTGTDKVEGHTGVNVSSNGMQYLVNMIRELGAKNVVIVDTPMWSSMFDGILSGQYALKDPNGNGVIYDPHIYTEVSDSHQNIMELAKTYPVVVGEVNSRMGHTNMVAQADFDFFDDFFRTAEEYQFGICPWVFALEGNSWGMLKLKESGDISSMTYTKIGQYFKDGFAKIASTKAVQLKSQNGQIALYHGKYTKEQLKKQGFDLQNISSVTKSDTYFNYKICLYEKSNFTGKTVEFYNKCSNLKSIGLDFVPEAVSVTQINGENILKNSTIKASGTTDLTKALVDGTDAFWQDNTSGVKTIIFELDKPYILLSTVLKSSTMGADYVLSDYNISVSTNGANYIRLAEIVNSDRTEKLNNYEGFVAKYLKITINKGCRLDSDDATIAEITAIGVGYDGAVKSPVPYSYIKNIDDFVYNELNPPFVDSEDIIDSETVNKNEDSIVKSDTETVNNNNDGVVIDSETANQNNDSLVTDSETANQNKDRVVKNRKLVYLTDWTMIIIIIAVSVVAVAAIAVTVIILIKKKRKKALSLPEVK